MKTRFIAKTFAWFALVAVILCSCDIFEDDYYDDYDTLVILSKIEANGSSTQTTTQIKLYFSASYWGPSASNISLSGIPGIKKGNLISNGYSYGDYSFTLPISGFTAGGTLSVSVSKSGYKINGSPKTVRIYYYAVPEVTFESVQADGSNSSTTTELKLTFSQEISNLTASDITLSGVTGVTKGTLSGSGKIYYLGISGFTKGGTLSMAVAKSGYSIKGSPQTVTIYKAP